MPISYCILKALPLYYAHWDGCILAGDVEQNFERYRSDGDFRRGMPELIDLRHVTDLQFETSFVQILVSKFRVQRVPKSGMTKTVILTGDALTYGRARQFQTHASMRGGIDVHITRSEFDALHEHGLPYGGIAQMLARHAPEWTPNDCIMEAC